MRWLIYIVTVIFAFGCEKAKPEQIYPAKIMQGFVDEAKRNGDWKDAVATAKHAQIIYMNISLETNPANESGVELHPFDQVVLIAEGWGRVTLDGDVQMIQAGDLIFIPQGVRHNIVNLNREQPLKLISIYTDQDMPKDTIYRTVLEERNRENK